MLLGFGLLVFGSHLMVDSAVDLAQAWGLSELVIGLTIVAIGTSLPELAASTVAAWRGETDIAVGNVIGSCLFNVLLILGVTASVQPLPVPESLVWVEIPLMTLFVVLLYPLVRGSLVLGRPQAMFLLVAFASFMVYALRDLYL